MPPPELKTAIAIEKLVPNRIEFISQTQAKRSYIIEPRVNGYLRTVDFQSGLMVEKGQLLFTIDDAPFRTVVTQARASLASARAQLVQAEAAYNRSVPLSAINAISRSQLDAATATLAAARESVASARAVLDNARLNIDYCRIVAPQSGIIAPSKANAGDYVGAGTQYQTLTTISFDDSVNVDLRLPTVRYYEIAKHNSPSYLSDSLLQNITLTLSDGTLYPPVGVYQYTKPEVDNQSGSIVFTVSFPNKEGLLKGGQFARVSADVGTPELRVLIAARAVNEIQGQYGVFVVDKGDTLRFQKIEVGGVVDSDWIVLSGIKAGDRVITEGLMKAKSGMKIRVKE